MDLLLCALLASDPLGDLGPMTPHDPWGRDTFSEFYRLTDVTRVPGLLTVGVPDRHIGGGLPHCRVASGYGGLSDGEYVVAGGALVPVRCLWW